MLLGDGGMVNIGQDFSLVIVMEVPWGTKRSWWALDFRQRLSLPLSFCCCCDTFRSCIRLFSGLYSVLLGHSSSRTYYPVFTYFFLGASLPFFIPYLEFLFDKVIHFALVGLILIFRFTFP